MAEKRRARASGGQAKVQRATTQTTLEDLFQRTNTVTDPPGKAQDLQPEHTDPAVSSPQSVDSRPPTPPRRPKPSQLYPIFTKVTSVSDKPRDTVINIDDTEVIDITDVSSDVDLSTEPHLSSALSSPRSESSHGTEPSPPPSPVVLGVHRCASATSLTHVGTHEPTHPKTSRNKESKRTLGLGDIAPFPSSCSQHVRGLQHSFTSTQAPIKRSILPRSRPSIEGTLDFLKKCQQLDDVPSTHLTSDRIHRTLTPQQCEEHLQSLGRDNTEFHPAFARISAHSESIPLRHAEAWTRRFRPRCANEVLGNEQHAIYLRDWLSALELHLRDRQLEEPVSKGATARENKQKGTSKRVEPRGVKRPRVIRSIGRKRGNKKRRVDSDDDLDDFVVFSDGDEERADEPVEDSEDELAFCQRTYTCLHRHDPVDVREADPVPATEINPTTSRLQEPARTNFDDHLTNTLLITGPPGCGKTAAVYACAEELGWDVFEVYPGIGRRNGANLEHLVGDVGRNHIVQTVHRRAPTKRSKLEVKERTGLEGYLAKRKGGELGGFAKARKAGSEGRPIDVEGDGPRQESQPLAGEQEMDLSEEAGISGTWPGGSDGSRRMVGQSLVLLEEVDILFKEDAGFWPAVIEFIECCQRPVVMTCNDPGLVPVSDLPLQRVLVFEPCPSTVAATFLQCLSLSEGCLVPREDLMVLYESTHYIDGVDIPDAPLYPRTEPLPLPDLRRSITQLQMLCAGGRHGSASEMHQGEEAEGHVRRSGRPISAECRVTAMESTAEREMWRKMRSESELMSHVDAQLCRPPMATLEALSTGTGGGEEEEEMGYVALCTGGGEGLVFYQRDEFIAEEAIRHSRGAHEGHGTGPIGASINPAARLRNEDVRARVAYRSRMGDALQGIVGPLMPHLSVFLDYIPWVRYMVAVEDVLERRAWEADAGAGAGRGRGRVRRTRNSQRAVWVRAVGDSEGQREVLRGSGLVDIEP